MLRKRLKYLFGSFAAVFLLLLVVATIINHFDPALSGEVQKILAHKAEYSETQKRAYFYLLGVLADDKDNPEKRGEELWAHHDEPDFWAQFAGAHPWANIFKGCGQSICTVRALEASPAIVEEVIKYKEPAARYVRLMEYGEGAGLFDGDERSIFSPVQTLPPAMHRLFIAQLAQWIRTGGQDRAYNALIASNHYMASFYNQGSLLQRMIALVNMKMNVDFALSERERNPKTHFGDDLISSITVPDLDKMMYGAVESELRVFKRIVDHLNSPADLSVASLAGAPDRAGPWWKQPLRLLSLRPIFRPNESVNKFWEISIQRLTTDCPADQADTKCIPAAAWTAMEYPWDYLVNPVGKQLVKLMSTNVQRSRAKAKERIDALVEAKQSL